MNDETRPDNGRSRPQPSPGVAGVTAYHVPRHPAPVDLYLDGNEGLIAPSGLLAALEDEGPDVLRRYPDARPLEAELARRLGVAPERLLVTAGADDGVDRMCRALLAPGRELVLPVPTFEMFERFARLAGADVRTVPWAPGPWPLDEVLAVLGPATAMIAMVSPNNPTGSVADEDAFVTLSRAAPGAVIAADLAYVEFADRDPTARLLDLPNVVVLRTLSKAWGLAGLRVGYAAGPVEIISWMRAAGSPYSVARPGLAVAARRLADGGEAVEQFIARVRHERRLLSELIAALGGEAIPGQGNFVLARFERAAWVKEGLAGLGIAVRDFPGKPGLEGCIRITCPGDGAQFDRLCSGLRATLAPQALLLDLDGVIADVSESYRQAMVRAAGEFGVTLEPAEIAAAKAEPGSNNDWMTTRRLLERHGVTATLQDVTARFEHAYQGTAEQPGLWTRDRLVVTPAELSALAARLPLAIVTGRPRRDAERFLDQAGIRPYIREMVCMEDAPLKPDPAPLRLAMQRLGVESAWMAGDTPDDLRAARAAGVVPLGVVAPGDVDGETPARLFAAGAARVLGGLRDLREVLP